MRLFALLIICACLFGCSAPVRSPDAPKLRNQPLDHFLFGVCYYPEQWPREYWERDARRMQESGVNAVRMGEFAWYRLEPREGTYDFAWLDEVIELLGRHGIKTILGTPTATPPKWLSERYPQVLHVYENGRPANDQSRRQCCYNSLKYRELCQRIVAAMAEHYRNSPHVIGWQVDNEMNNENKACFSESCRTGFREWLKARYGSLDALNERWGTQFWSQWYTSWDQVDLPFATPAWHNPALVLDHRRFVSDSATSFLEAQAGIIRGYRPDDFITHNGVFEGINYYRFARGLDLYAQDNYPTFLDEPRFPNGALLTAARSFNGRMMIMEELTGPAGQTYLLRTPAPGEMTFWTMQAIAHGADGVLHFRWRSARRGAEQYWAGVLDADDVPRARYDEFGREGRTLDKIGRAVVGSQLRSDIAVINDFEDEWVYDHQYFTKEVNPDRGVHLRSELIDLFRAASERGYNIDFVPPDADLSRYKIVFGPKLTLMDPGLAGRIAAFVKGGGTFLLSAHSGVKDRDGAVVDKVAPGLLADLFGVEVETYQCYQPPSDQDRRPSRERNALRFDDAAPVPVFVFADVLKPRGDQPAKVVATWDRDFIAGKPACTERAVGKGTAVYYGSFFDLESARAMLKRYEHGAGLTPVLSDLPPEVEVTRRSKGDASFYFVLNHGAAPATVKLAQGCVDLVTDQPVPATITVGRGEWRVLRKND
jgi:beta-galactosidase